MAEGFLKSFDSKLKVYSAGTNPSTEVHPKAIVVMREIGIDLSINYPKRLDDFLNDEFDYVVTVCGGAKENCPTFNGIVKNHMHVGFDDPADAIGTSVEIYNEFRRIRDEIKRDFYKFYQNFLSTKNK